MPLLQFKTVQAKITTRLSRAILTPLAKLILVSAVTASFGVTSTASAQEFRAPRVVGGVDAQANAYPWMVAIVEAGRDSYNGQFCGASLVAKNWVLTAAHCVEDVRPSEIYTAIGRSDLRGSRGETRNVSRIVVHPDYARYGAPDVALLKLSSDSTLTPVELVSPASNLATPGTTATVIGWGATIENGSGTRYLQEANIPIVTHASCNRSYGGGVDERLEICAGLSSGGRDACQGDSGGPLFVKSNQGDRLLQAGVVSWGIGCAQPGFPGVYARVSTMVDWVSQTTANAINPNSPPNTDPGNTDSGVGGGALTASFTTTCLAQECTFDASTSTAGSWSINEYVWDLGDGTWDYGRVINRRYANASTYSVRLFVIDTNGDQNSTTQIAKSVDYGSFDPVRYSGYLSAGQKIFLPDANGFWATQGAMKAALKHAKGANFDLKLHRLNAATGQWERVQRSLTTGTNEKIIDNAAPAGQYRLRVVSKEGSGNYTLTIRHE